jgi:hypothetical protein
MTVNLDEIRTAVINYVDTKVTVRVAEIDMTGTSINPGEPFSVVLEASNANAAAGGIPLKDVVWYVIIQRDDVATFTVPQPPVVARSGLSRFLPALTPGSQVREMYIFPTTAVSNHLSVGDTDTLTVNCRAGSDAAGGTCFMFAKIFATVDHDWLYPPDQDSVSGVALISVVG